RVNNNANRNPLYIYHLSEGSGGDLLLSWSRTSITYTDNTTEAGGPVLMRLNKQGDVVWSKFVPVDDYYSVNLAGIFLVNGNIVVIGEGIDSTSSCYLNGKGAAFLLLQLNYQTGDIQKKKSYCFQEFASSVWQIEIPIHHYSAIKMQ